MSAMYTWRGVVIFLVCLTMMATRGASQITECDMRLKNCTNVIDDIYAKMNLTSSESQFHQYVWHICTIELPKMQACVGSVLNTCFANITSPYVEKYMLSIKNECAIDACNRTLTNCTTKASAIVSALQASYPSDPAKYQEYAEILCTEELHIMQDCVNTALNSTCSAVNISIDVQSQVSFLKNICASTQCAIKMQNCTAVLKTSYEGMKMNDPSQIPQYVNSLCGTMLPTVRACLEKAEESCQYPAGSGIVQYLDQYTQLCGAQPCLAKTMTCFTSFLTGDWVQNFMMLLSNQGDLTFSQAFCRDWQNVTMCLENSFQNCPGQWSSLAMVKQIGNQQYDQLCQPSNCSLHMQVCFNKFTTANVQMAKKMYANPFAIIDQAKEVCNITLPMMDYCLSKYTELCPSMLSEFNVQNYFTQYKQLCSSQGCFAEAMTCLNEKADLNWMQQFMTIASHVNSGNLKDAVESFCRIHPVVSDCLEHSFESCPEQKSVLVWLREMSRQQNDLYCKPNGCDIGALKCLAKVYEEMHLNQSDIKSLAEMAEMGKSHAKKFFCDVSTFLSGCVNDAYQQCSDIYSSYWQSKQAAYQQISHSCKPCSSATPAVSNGKYHRMDRIVLIVQWFAHYCEDPLCH